MFFVDKLGFLSICEKYYEFIISKSILLKSIQQIKHINMKKTTLLFFVALLSSYSLLAQHTFGTQAGPYSVVADDGPVTVGINDVGNTAAAPRWKL